MSPIVTDSLPHAAALLRGWQGRTIATFTGALNTIIDVRPTEVIVGTDRTPGGSAIPLKMVQPALDLLTRAGEVEISVEAIGHRSAFCGAMLLTLPGVIKLPGEHARVGWRSAREIATPSSADRGGIRPWWAGRAAEYLWMENTERQDIGADLHCPQRDSSDPPRANSGFSTILFVADGDIVVHYDRTRQLINKWSIARGAVESGATLWASHRGSVRRRLGSEPREQPGWWIDLEGPFHIDPITLADLCNNGKTSLHVRSPSALACTPLARPSHTYFRRVKRRCSLERKRSRPLLA